MGTVTHAHGSVAVGTGFDPESVRRDFPILKRRVRGNPLVYLDNAATTQKPQPVIDALVQYYASQNANVHRGIHHLSEIATQAYEDVRAKVQRFINAASVREIVFVRGATEAINLVASSFGHAYLNAGDEVVITGMEHHSNIVPWQLACQRRGAHLIVVPITDSGEVVVEEYERRLSPRTKIAALTHVSNALGTVNPVKEMVRLAHQKGIPVLVDGAQAMPHLRVDVRELGCDFYVFSGHKMFGPTGIGVLYGKEEILSAMPPYQGGGDMIKSVSFERTIYHDLPYRFEAGTPNIADGIAYGAALDYLTRLDWQVVANYERALLLYATNAVSTVSGLRIIGTATEKAGVVSFVLDGIHPHDIGTILDQEGIAIRTGHHCAQPVMDRFGIPATARASFAFYNTQEEADRLVIGIQKVVEVFK